jgi:hypothetical protein
MNVDLQRHPGKEARESFSIALPRLGREKLSRVSIPDAKPATPSPLKKFVKTRSGSTEHREVKTFPRMLRQPLRQWKLSRVSLRLNPRPFTFPPFTAQQAKDI